jgi:hypothetical protein
MHWRFQSNGNSALEVGIVPETELSKKGEFMSENVGFFMTYGLNAHKIQGICSAETFASELMDVLDVRKGQWVDVLFDYQGVAVLTNSKLSNLTIYSCDTHVQASQQCSYCRILSF